MDDFSTGWWLTGHASGHKISAPVTPHNNNNKNKNNNNNKLFQHIAVTIQRFNSVLFWDSFFVSRESQDNSDAYPVATPAFDFNFFELLILGIFTTEGEKNYYYYYYYYYYYKTDNF